MTLIRGNALAVPLADESVDLVVTSPPYFALRSYTDACATCGGKNDPRPQSRPIRRCMACWPHRSDSDRVKCNKCQGPTVALPAEVPDRDCPDCDGAGRGHYDGQIGSESTPAEFVAALLAVTAECVRVLKPSGSLWVNLGDKYASGGRNTYDTDAKNGGRGGARPDDGARAKSLLGLPWRYALACIDDLGLILRAEVIWSKPNGLPESVQDRVRRSHEQWFHFTKEPRYYSGIDEIREPYNPATENRYLYAKNNMTENRGAALAAAGMVHQGPIRSDIEAGHQVNPLGKLPGSVWTIHTEPLRVPDHLPQHFAAFPSEWPRRIILGWSPEGGRILDPFAGTGTTVAVANALGRHGIGLDLSADYLKLARWRCQDPNLRAKVLGHDKPKPEVDGQLTLEVVA